jgi:hypothetical protein
MLEGKIPVTWKQTDYKNGEWRSYYNNFTGFTTTETIRETYKSTMGVHLNNDVPMKLREVVWQNFKLDKIVIALNKLSPGQILPWHKDRYLTYIEKNKIENKNKIARIILFLEDQEPGQQLWIGDKFCTGPAGSYFGWHYGQEHMAANLGKKDRHTLQITGTNTHTKC